MDWKVELAQVEELTDDPDGFVSVSCKTNLQI